MYLLILVAFLLGNLLLGAAAARTARADPATATRSSSLGMWVAGALWAAAALTLLLLVPEFGGPSVPGTAWLYPLIQPAGRTLIGIWLWREAATERR
jgi:hypothetical protein